MSVVAWHRQASPPSRVENSALVFCPVSIGLSIIT
jgi:hypothetical protein